MEIENTQFSVDSFSISSSVAILDSQLRLMLLQIELAAFRIIATPVIEEKLLLARHLHQDVRFATKLASRIQELSSVRPNLTDLRRALRDNLHSDASTNSLRANIKDYYESVKGDARRQFARSVSSIHPLWDEPTHNILADALNNIERQIAEASKLYGEIRELVSEKVPEPGVTPARDRRLTVIPHTQLKQDRSTWKQNLAELMHYTLLATEVPTIEICCGYIRDFEDFPWDFLCDIARQVWDEARHADACIDRMRDVGCAIGDYPCDHRNWLLTSNRPLAQRLAIHQRIGEWLGVDAAIHWAAKIAGFHDQKTACMLSFIANDEVLHVGLGNKWLRMFCSTQEEVERVHADAESARSSAMNVNGHRSFVVNVEMCRRSGFTEAEIDRLLSQSERLG